MAKILNLKVLKSIFFIGVMITIIATTHGCKKYEDGPHLSLRSKTSRVGNLWKVEKYFVNGVDQTISFYSTKPGYRQSFDVNGQYAETYTNYGAFGMWSFVDNKDEISIAIGSNVTVITIEKLKSKQFWYYTMVGSNKIEYQMIPG